MLLGLFLGLGIFSLLFLPLVSELVGEEFLLHVGPILLHQHLKVLVRYAGVDALISHLMPLLFKEVADGLVAYVKVFSGFTYLNVFTHTVPFLVYRIFTSE